MWFICTSGSSNSLSTRAVAMGGRRASCPRHRGGEGVPKSSRRVSIDSLMTFFCLWRLFLSWGALSVNCMLCILWQPFLGFFACQVYFLFGGWGAPPVCFVPGAWNPSYGSAEYSHFYTKIKSLSVVSSSIPPPVPHSGVWYWCFVNMSRLFIFISQETVYIHRYI